MTRIACFIALALPLILFKLLRPKSKVPGGKLLRRMGRLAVSTTATRPRLRRVRTRSGGSGNASPRASPAGWPMISSGWVWNRAASVLDEQKAS